MPHSMIMDEDDGEYEGMMMDRMGSSQPEKPEEQPETDQAIERIIIEPQEGGFKYSVQFAAGEGGEAGSKDYNYADPKEVMQAVMDDLSSPHKRKPEGSFRSMAAKLSHQKGVRDPEALAASIKDKKYGKSWRSEGR